MKKTILLFSLAAIAFWIVSKSRSSTEHLWTVGVKQDGQTIKEIKTNSSEDVFETRRRVRAIVDSHIIEGSSRTAEITIWRSSSRTEQIVATDKLIDLTNTYTQTIGPVYATIDLDGRCRVFQESNGKPQIMAEGLQMDVNDIREIITQILADNLQRSSDYHWDKFRNL
jgi:hypothetical protein